MKNPVKNGFDHASKETIGVLLANLGTPVAPDKKSVRKFLKEFLWDSRVIEMPRILWWLVLNLFILNTRPKRSAGAYKKIWSDAGSPLMAISKAQLRALQQAYANSNIVVAAAMRYGQPSIAKGLQQLQHEGATRIVVLPLYPQYSATTTATTFDAVAKELKQWRRIPEMRFINHYHDNPKYIDALCNAIQQHWQQHARADKLVMSFHGIPHAYFKKGDHYYCECHKTSRLLAEQLALSDDQWQLTFQSRLGPKRWLKPYTDKTLHKLPPKGIKSVQVICPGFSADCLETLEEIAMQNQQIFMQAGGERYEYIACLNASRAHIDMMVALVDQHTQGWHDTQQNLELRKSLAIAGGAKS